MTKWSDLWVKPSVMVAMGVEVRTAGWLERVEKEGYLMEAKLEAIQKHFELVYPVAESEQRALKQLFKDDPEGEATLLYGFLKQTREVLGG